MNEKKVLHGRRQTALVDGPALSRCRHGIPDFVEHELSPSYVQLACVVGALWLSDAYAWALVAVTEPGQGTGQCSITVQQVTYVALHPKEILASCSPNWSLLKWGANGGTECSGKGWKRRGHMKLSTGKK